ncbi:MAG: permease-like cell division protein FtsX [Bacteroidota bacterium]
MAPSTTSKLARRRPNYTYVIVSVAIMLFFLGFFGAVLLNTQNLVDFFKEQVSIMIELEDQTEESGVEQLSDELYSSYYLKDSSLVFVTKEEGAALLQEEFGEDFLSLDMPNPLYDILTFRVKASYLDADSLATIRTDLKRYPFVNDVFYQESLINEMAQNVESLAYFAFGISLFLIAIAILLIHNTIRLALYANRFLIKNMQLVGASWGFISRPYLWRSFGHGVLSALIAITGLVLLYAFARNQFYQLDEISSWWETGLLFLGLTALGAAITTLSAYYVVNKYLRMREDDLY